MRLIGWIFKEIRYRWMTSLLLFLAPCTFVLLWIVILNTLKAQELVYKEQYAQREQHLKDQMHTMWDEYRKITKNLGFNVLIIPKDQNLADFYAEQFSSRYMPESYADTLANSDVATIQHILPALLQKVFWKEKKRSVLVYGVRGELHSSLKTGLKAKSPIMQPVKKESLILGFELSKNLGIKKGDRCSFLGKTFTVEDCYPKRGNRDDITVWMPLDEAQMLFDKRGLINSILALECRCAADQNLPNLAKIRTELEKVLPQTQVIEFKSEVIARAEARFAAWELEKKTVEEEHAHAIHQMGEYRLYATVFLSIITIAIIVFSTLIHNLSFRARYQELAILRATGFNNGKLLTLLIGKIVVLALLGSFLGLLASSMGITLVSKFLMFTMLAENSSNSNIILKIGVLFISVVVSVSAGSIPAVTLYRKTYKEIQIH